MDKFVAEEKSNEEYGAVQHPEGSLPQGGPSQSVCCVRNRHRWPPRSAWFPTGKDVYVIATANDLDPIPDSLLRAGRFDRKIDVTAPAGKDAENIIRFYLENKNLGQSVNFRLSSRTKSPSG